jgi:GTPase SAR1 family protein
MTERQDLAAAPAPWTGAGGPIPAVSAEAARAATGVAEGAGDNPDRAGSEPVPGTGGGSRAEGSDPEQADNTGGPGPDQGGLSSRPGPEQGGPQAGQPRQAPQAAPYSGGRAHPGGAAQGGQRPGASVGSAWARPATGAGGRYSPGARLSGPDSGVVAEPDEPYARVDARKLEAALLGLRKPIVSVPLLLAAPGVEEARAERLKLLSQIDDYLLPRLRQSGAPILVALVGSTGAGKSTLMNSLVGKQVSATGIRRPTTNSPVLACHPNDVRWFAENVFLPTLPRVRQQGLAMPGRDGLLVLAASEGMPEGVAVLDTPDIDSVVKAHRDFANQFLDASDLWLFVTTARRYADAAVWEMLKDARNRGAALAIALSRVPPAAAPELAAHFDAMLDANGLREVRRFMIPETVVTDAQLPTEVTAPIKDYLTDTARREDRRVAVLTQTMSGVLDTFRDRVPALADHASTQLAIRQELRDSVAAAYAESLTEFDEATKNGSLLQGEVMARWQDFAGAGDLLKALQARRGRGQAGKGKKQRLPARAGALKAALHASLESLVVAMADRAAEQAVARWQDNPAGADLLQQRSAPSARPHDAAGTSSESDFVTSALADMGVLDGAADSDQAGPAALARASAALPVLSARAVGAWQAHVLHLVRAENVTKRSIARVVSFDQESLALVLAVGVLGYGAFGEPASGASSAVPQRLLTSLFGAGLLRDIGVRARLDLHERISLIFEEEARRFADLLDAADVPGETLATELLQAGFTLESAR